MIISKETRSKISINHADVSGNRNPMFGKHHSQETKDKISKKLKGKCTREKCHFWNGGVYTTPSGYIMVFKPDHPNCNLSGYVREHRLIMEKKIGRYLTKDEIVHHINGEKKDNNIDNLEITNRGFHNKIHLRHLGRKRDEKGRWI